MESCQPLYQGKSKGNKRIVEAEAERQGTALPPFIMESNIRENLIAVSGKAVEEIRKLEVSFNV